MHYLCVALIVFIKYVCFVRGQASCVTPNGVTGTCKLLTECPSLLGILNKNTRTPGDVEFLRRSQCGFQDSVPTVCCPPVKKPVCYTPDGNPGSCVDVNKCKRIAEMMAPPFSQENISFVQNSRCLGPTKYSVCCGSTSTNTTRIPDGKSCQTTVTAYPPDPATDCCGKDISERNKIAGGDMTQINQYPWLVLIDYHKDGVDKHLCGGALISGRYVLTAAHCVVGEILKLGTPRTVRLGEYDAANDAPDCVLQENEIYCSDDVLKIPIDSIIPHPEYISNTPERKNDIALIRLGSLAPFTNFIRPICLPQTDLTLDPPSSFTFLMAGWGVDNATNPSSAVVKRQVDLPFVNADDCDEVYSVPGRRIRLWKKQLCAGGIKGKNYCKGDSGGPLMYDNRGTFEAIGVVSFGLLSCGKAEVPGIYTKVFEFKDWIMKNIKP